MPLILLHSLGRHGILKDTPFHELPPRAWTDGKNVRFIDGGVEPVGGTTVIRDPSLFAAPRYGLFVSQTDFKGLLVATNLKIFAVDSANNYNLTRQTAGVDVDYTASNAIAWTGGTLTGVPFLNNYSDLPQVWSPVLTSQKMQNIPNLTSTVRFKTLRAYKNFLVGLGVKKGLTEFPHMVKWSHAADPGTVPSSWDETDASKLAGEQDIGDSQGINVDCLPMYDSNIVYKQDAVWSMNFIGAPFVFSFRKIFVDFGLLTQNCVVDIGGKHVVLSADDLVVHNGNSWEGVLPKAWRRKLFQDLNGAALNAAYLYYHRPKKEIWICYPGPSATIANKVLIWNWKDQTFGMHDIEDAGYIFEASTTSFSDTWDTDSQVWNLDNTTWDNPGIDARGLGPVSVVQKTPGKILQLDSGNSFAGSSREVIAERVGIAVDGGRTLEGEPRCDLGSIKFVSSIRPRFESVTPTSLEFYIGTQMFVEGPVTWNGPYTVNDATGFKIDVALTARLIGFKVRSTADVTWRLWGFDLDIKPVSLL